SGLPRSRKALVHSTSRAIGSSWKDMCRQCKERGMSEQMSWGREIISTHSHVKAETLGALPGDLRAWLVEQARGDTGKLGLRWLLAHSDDGVIWGKLRDDGQLYLSSDVFPVRGLSLHSATLQQARLFGEHAELLIWRGPYNTWQTVLRRDD